MKNAPHTLTNDNDTWQTLAAPTARVVSKLEKDQEKGSKEDAGAPDKAKQNSEQHREYVERRLRDLAKFEALYRGATRRR